MRLTDDERAMLAWALADHACTHRGTEDDAAITGCSECQLISECGVWPAVEAILTARLAAVEADRDHWQDKWKRRGVTINRLKSERDQYRQESAEHLALLDGGTALALARAALTPEATP